MVTISPQPAYALLTESCAVSSWQVYAAGKYAVTVPENDFTTHLSPWAPAELAVIVMVNVPTTVLLGPAQVQ